MKHYSIRTEIAYIQWIKRYILFQNKKHPLEMGAREITAYLSYLALHVKVAAATQNQALNALVFMYHEVLKKDIEMLGNFHRTKRPHRIPIVLTKNEVLNLFRYLDGENKLMAGLMYGSGLRLMECVRLRIKDIDVSCNHVIIRDGKGNKGSLAVQSPLDTSS